MKNILIQLISDLSKTRNYLNVADGVTRTEIKIENHQLLTEHSPPFAATNN